MNMQRAAASGSGAISASERCIWFTIVVVLVLLLLFSAGAPSPTSQYRAELASAQSKARSSDSSINSKAKKSSPSSSFGKDWSDFIDGAAVVARPLKWRGSGKNFKKTGTCWCGADAYCMCTPSVAVDLIIEYVPSDGGGGGGGGGDGGGGGGGAEPTGLLLVKRRDNSLWATMGGFVEVGESAEETVRRELKEETGLELADTHERPILLGVYSDPRRDPRRHSVSIVYVARVTGGAPRAGDDVKNVRVVSFEDAAAMPPEAWSFDMHKYMRDYFALKKHSGVVKHKVKKEHEHDDDDDHDDGSVSAVRSVCSPRKIAEHFHPK